MTENERLARKAAGNILMIILIKWIVIFLITRLARKAIESVEE